jgi:16S rRNA (guanine527-N7)-methyltransferase
VDPLSEILLQGLEELPAGGRAPTEAAALLARLSQQLLRWSKRMNLTGHRDSEAIARRLILDALALGAALPGGVPPTLADLGSGAGFPGLPLAIWWPSCRVTLVESRERRHHFQRDVIRLLGLGNATPLRGRAETLEPMPHRVVVAQAAARPGRALGWMIRWAEPGGVLVVPTGAEPPIVDPPRGVRALERRHYRVPCGGGTRAFLVGHLEPAASV